MTFSSVPNPAKDTKSKSVTPSTAAAASATTTFFTASTSTAVSLLDTKHINNKSALSAPAALFNRRVCPSLQNIILKELFRKQGNHQKLLEYLTTEDNKLFDPAAKEALRVAFRPVLVPNLIQAMIDEDSEAVKRLLDFDPGLLLIDPSSVGMKTVESKWTRQTFLTEKPLIMAQKLKRLQMTKLMLPYFEKIEAAKAKKANDTKDEKTEVQKQWILPLLSETEQKIQDSKDEALQQKYIQEYLKPLIDTIVRDDKASVETQYLDHLSDEFYEYYKLKITISNESEEEFKKFRKTLLPEEAISIDNYFDIEQFLIAAHKARSTYYDTFKNHGQRDVFTVHVIMYMMTLLSSELANSCCERLKSADNIFSRSWDGLKSKKRPFYPTNRNVWPPKVCPIPYLCSEWSHDSYNWAAWDWLRNLGKLHKENAAEFGKLTAQVQRSSQHVTSRCVIL